ncbi:MAG: response regulator transcription factor [Burkholderiales bacterium]|nr:response regulator transcription factor [Burkholderiales bacterium]
MDQVLLVEDDVPTREWLVALLTSAGEPQLAHACGTVQEALAWLRAGRPADVVLTDLGLPDGSGLEVIREACRTPGREVLVLSIFGDESNVLSAIYAGAGGYLLKDGSVDSIREHLHCLRSGGSPLSPRIARTLIRRTRQAPGTETSPTTAFRPRDDATSAVAPSAPGSPLSERELDVLTGISKGFSYVEVATALGITTNTVRTHVRKIYDKLAVNSRLEALYEYNRRMDEQGRPRIC